MTNMLKILAAALSLAVAPAAATLSVEFHNGAGNSVTLMEGCKSWGHFAPGESQVFNFTSGPTKLWAVPDGCTQKEGCYQCNLDCLGCFYLSAIVSVDGIALVTGIGYGHNTPVEVHNDVGNSTFAAVNQFGKPDEASCSTTSCDFDHIIQAHGDTSKWTLGFVPGSDVDAGEILV